jgi:hypothetical protein
MEKNACSVWIELLEALIAVIAEVQAEESDGPKAGGSQV